MQPQSSVLACYNQTAGAYAAKFSGELTHKHFDRFLLKAFADKTKGSTPSLTPAVAPDQHNLSLLLQ